MAKAKLAAVDDNQNLIDLLTMLLKPSFAADDKEKTKRANSVSSVASRQMMTTDGYVLNQNKVNNSGSPRKVANNSNGPRFQKKPRFVNRTIEAHEKVDSLNTSVASSVVPFSVPIEIKSKYE